jgi:hypothetical protein
LKKHLWQVNLDSTPLQMLSKRFLEVDFHNPFLLCSPPSHLLRLALFIRQGFRFSEGRNVR